MNNTPTKLREFELTIRPDGRTTLRPMGYQVLSPTVEVIICREILPEQEPPTAPPCHLEARVAHLEGIIQNHVNQDAPDAPQAILEQNTGITVQDGKWYEARDGRVDGPTTVNLNEFFPFRTARGIFTTLGKWSLDGKTDHDYDLVREVPAPFDWAKLWTDAPSWMDYASMDESGRWLLHEGKPAITAASHWTAEGGSIFIPETHAPPRVSDWTQSLTVRPGLEVGS